MSRSLRVARRGLGGRRQNALVAARPIARGERIYRFAGPVVSRDEILRRIEAGEVRTGDDPLEIGIDRYIRLTGPGRFLNHSCEPTAGLSGERDLVALVDLAEGDEVTVDYSTNASSRHGYRMRFTCACGAAGCRGEIGDLSTLPPGRLRFYLESGALQDYLLDEARELLAATGD